MSNSEDFFQNQLGIKFAALKKHSHVLPYFPFLSILPSNAGITKIRNASLRALLKTVRRRKFDNIKFIFGSGDARSGAHFCYEYF